jgi:hypothetical protein
MSFNILWEERGVVKHFNMQVTVEEVQVATLRVEASERFDSCRYVINDFSACTSIIVNHDVVKEIAIVDGAAMRTNPYIRVAVVTTMPEIIEMAEAYANSSYHSYPTRIFSALQEARHWAMAKDKS